MTQKLAQSLRNPSPEGVKPPTRWGLAVSLRAFERTGLQFTTAFLFFFLSVCLRSARRQCTSFNASGHLNLELEEQEKRNRRIAS